MHSVPFIVPLLLLSSSQKCTHKIWPKVNDVYRQLIDMYKYKTICECVVSHHTIHALFRSNRSIRNKNRNKSCKHWIKRWTYWISGFAAAAANAKLIFMPFELEQHQNNPIENANAPIERTTRSAWIFANANNAQRIAQPNTNSYTLHTTMHLCSVIVGHLFILIK